MRNPQVIAEFVQALSDRLSFDPSLSQRVRREIEDHLWEAVAESTAPDQQAAAAQAVARFGDPQALAAEFATARLAGQTYTINATVVVLVGAMLLAMKVRVAWYGVVQWQLSDELRAHAATVGAIDSGTFWLAAALAVIGWLYLWGRPVAGTTAALCRQLRLVVGLNSVTAIAVAISVMCDAALTAFRLVGRELSLHSLIPLSSMLVEVTLAGVLIFMIARLATRMMRTTALLNV